MPKMKTFILAGVAPALLFAGTAGASATRSNDARPVGTNAIEDCIVRLDTLGQRVVTPWQRKHCADLAKGATGDAANGHGFLGMGGGGVIVVGGIVAGGIGVGAAAGGNNSPGG